MHSFSPAESLKWIALVHLTQKMSILCCSQLRRSNCHSCSPRIYKCPCLFTWGWSYFRGNLITFLHSQTKQTWVCTNPGLRLYDTSQRIEGRLGGNQANAWRAQWLRAERFGITTTPWWMFQSMRRSSELTCAYVPTRCFKPPSISGDMISRSFTNIGRIETPESEKLDL